MGFTLEAHKNHLRKIFIFFIYFFASWVILLAFIAFPRLNGHPPAMFHDMVYGTAHRPFVYRALVPGAVRIITDLTPQSVIRNVEYAASYKRPLERLVTISQIPDEYVYEYLVALAIIYCCFFLFAFLIRQLINHYYTYPPFVGDLAPLGALLIMPAFFRYDNYLYDPATIFLFTLGLLVISRGRTILFYFVFILACINKETALLLSITFFLYSRHLMNRVTFGGHMLTQLLLWLGIRISIMDYFSGNPGSNVEIHLFDQNLTLFTHAFQAVYFIIFMGLYVLLLSYKWKQKPYILRLGFVASFLPLIIAGMIFGFVDEVRIYYEVYPFAFLLALPTVVDIFGRQNRDLRDYHAGAVAD